MLIGETTTQIGGGSFWKKLAQVTIPGFGGVGAARYTREETWAELEV